MATTRPSRAEFLSDGSADPFLVDAVLAGEHALARTLIAADGTPEAPNQAPTVTIDLNGAPLGAETPVNTVTTNARINPAVASLAGGHVVVRNSFGQNGSGFGVCAQCIDAERLEA